MSTSWWPLWTQVFDAANPLPALLPSPVLQRLWLHLGWGVVACGFVCALWRHCGARRAQARAAGAVVALLAVVGYLHGGAWSPLVWWGLAFQMPSVSLVVLGMVLTAGRQGVTELGRSGWVVFGSGLGWLLLADQLALLPWAIFPWGFAAPTAGLVMALLLLPWVWSGAHGRATGVVALAVGGIFVGTRLPTGNAWDAVLDPVLWLILQALLVQRVVARVRARKALTEKIH